MASAAPANQLPLFYNGLEPLSSTAHSNFSTRAAESAPFLAATHAIPVTVDEFVSVQRFCPIVFSVGDNPVPLALMGLNEGVNVFVDNDGKLLGEMYVPAYVRRYPFMLARIRPDADELSLCFDPESGLVGEYEGGNALFADGQPTETTQAILKFCEEFEMSAQRTNAFMDELKMVAEEKLRELRGDELRKMNQNGMLMLIMAHIFSLQLVPEIFSKQVQQGKGPQLGFTAEPAIA
jgi:hypothetical protein